MIKNVSARSLAKGNPARIICNNSPLVIGCVSLGQGYLG